MRRAAFLLAAGWIAALALPAAAQAPQSPQSPQGQGPEGVPGNIRGKVVKLTGQDLDVTTREGQTIAIILPANVRIGSLVRKQVSDIHPGDFVGTTSVPGTDGKLHAVEIHFFPANTPIPDRQFPWDYAPGSLMTNAHVTGLAKAAQGNTLSVDYKNGTAQIIVDPTTVITAPDPKPDTPADLQPGRAIFIAVSKAPNGTLTAQRITVEKNGVKPPM